VTGPGARRCALAVAVWLLALPAGMAKAADPNPLELAVKAAFIYKFQFYVSWPPRAYTAPDSPFKLCIVGDDPFGNLIDQAVSGQRVGGRTIAVARLSSVSVDDHCQMLYLGTEDPRLARQELSAVDGQPVLTITDAISDDSAKGMINFVIADDRVRFEIDDAAAARDGLPISSKLLSVALSVRPLP